MAEQKEQLIDTLTEHESEINEKTSKIEELEMKLVEMSKEVDDAKNQFASSRDEYVEQLQGKVSALKTIFDENNDLLEGQANELRNKQETIESLNGQIMELYKVMEENANKVIEKEDEISYLQEIIDRNERQIRELKDKCDRYESSVQKLEVELQRKSKEIEALNQNASKAVDTSDEIGKLKKNYETTITDLELKNKEQLDKLKKFAANLKKKNTQCAELEQKIQTFENSAVDNRITELTQKLENLQQLLFQKDQEINVMKHETSRVAVAIQQSSSVQDTQHSTIIEKLKKSHADAISKMSDEIDSRNQQLTDVHNQLTELNRRYNSDLANKNAELENLKLRMNEKVQAMDELTVNLERKNSEVLTLQNSLKELNSNLAATSEDLKSKNVKIEKCRAVIKEKNQMIQKLTTSVSEYQRKVEEQQCEKSATDPMQAQYESLKDELTRSTANYEAMVASLQAQLASFGGLEIKNEENEHYIESLRETNQKLNDKIAKLEEGIGHIEERRSSLERHANLLGSTLQEKTSEFQKNEDELVSRLQALSQHDETIEQRLHEADMEKQELIENLSEMTKQRNELIQKLQLVESQMAEIQSTTLSDLESDNATLMEQVKVLQQDIKRQSSEFERKMDEQRNVVAELENDLSAQLQRLTDERRDLQHNLEKSKDQINDLNCDIVRFKEIITSLEQTNSDLENEMTWIKMQNESMNQDHIENQELRMQIVHDQTEIENLKEQTESLQQNHERELAALKQQIIELDSLRAQIGQNQTDDQVFIQNENERLQGLLATKDLEIQNYQRQNLQLQMSMASSVPATSDPFNSISATAHTSPPSYHTDSDELLILSKKVEDLELKLQATSTEAAAFQERNAELQAQNSQKDNLIQDANRRHDQLQEEFKDRLSQLEQQNNELRHLSEEKEIEVKRLQNENEKNNSATISQNKVHEMQTNIQQLDQYIADLQIQLRISTNDCEQSAATIQSLEQEVQSRTAKYEAEIEALRLEVNRLSTTPPQAIEEVISQRSMASHTAAEPQQSIADIERLIIPTIHSTDPHAPEKPSGLPSFNSSMFFGSIEPTAFDDAFSSSQPDSAFPPDPENRIPVVEPPIVVKKAYICHPDEKKTESTTDDSIDYSKRRPVVEEVCLVKKAYVCHPEEVEGTSATDDGWGFGSDDAILEEKHQQMTGSITTSSLVPAHIGQTLQEYEDAVSS